MQNEIEKSQPVYLVRLFYRFLDRLLLIKRRLQFHAGLTLLTLLGIILSVGLVTNASFFAEGVDRVILLQNLAEFSRVTGRPPFSTNVYVFPSNRAPLTLEDAERLAPNIGDLLSSEVGLPLRRLVLSISSGTMLMQPELESPLYGEGKDYLGNFNAFYINDIAEHMVIDQGVELDEEGTSGSVLDVWMYTSLVQEMGLHVGEQFIIRPNATKDPVSIRLVGIWHAEDPENEFWFGNPDRQLKDSLIIRKADYIKFIQPMVPSGSREASWYVILDETEMIPGESASYLAGFEQSQKLIDEFLPDVRFNMPPLDPLEDFVQRSTSLTIILLGYNLPAFLILLYFLLLISTIAAQWQRSEISIFISRGVSIFGIANLTLLEQLVLFIICLPLGIAAGLLIARVMGYTSSFLSFSERAPLPVSLQGFSISLLGLALGVSLVSRVWPILRTNRQNVIAEGHEWTRITRGPFWYRAYLDLLLLLPTYYAYSQIKQRGSLAGLIVNQPQDLYQDPLLIVVPALFVVTTALMTMRLFSIVMRVLDVLANRTPWLPIHLALRQLGRQSHEYINPLLLVIIALAMGIYTLSMATSLDQWLVDRMYYQAGADITFLPQPLSAGVTFTDGNWVPAPEDFLKVEGVLGATRVGKYSTIVSPPGARDFVGEFMAIDRLDFPKVAWWRSDLSPESLGGLMNRLAAGPENILVSQDFITNYGLQIGDQLPLEVNLTDYFILRYEATIAGVFEYFPTVYEDEGYTLIGNMEQLNILSSITPTHEIWLKITPQADEKEIRQALPGTVGVVPNIGQDARVLISQEEAKFERVGIFGTLSIGFLASAVMAILGLLIYSYASLRGRMYKFSVLHAVGLLHRQIVAQVVIEYTFLAIFGALAGTLIGMFAARLFVPFFRFTGDVGVPIPPLIPLMDDQSIITLAIIFSLVVVLAEVLTITSALHQKLERIR